MPEIKTIFFDLGDTLGVPVLSESGELERIDLLDFTVTVLKDLKARNIPMGIISNTGKIPGAKINDLLQAAGILNFFDSKLLIYSADVNATKKSTQIFVLAASRATQSEQNCLFVGEDAAERQVALSAGFAVCPHPLLVDETLVGQSLHYVRINPPERATPARMRQELARLPVLPLHVEGPDGQTLYAITSMRTIVPTLVNMQFRLTPLGGKNEPLTTDAYLLRDDRAKESGAFLPQGESSKLFSTATPTTPTILHTDAGKIFVALPANVPLQGIHFDAARHGHTLRLMPKPELLRPAPPPSRTLAAIASGFAPPTIPPAVRAALDNITAAIIRTSVERFTGESPVSPPRQEKIDSRHVSNVHNLAAVNAIAAEFRAIGGGRLKVRLPQFSHKGETLQNVEADLPGDSPELVLVTAHLDSTAAASTPFDPVHSPAPGADDDMSGIAALFAIARAFVTLTAERAFERTVRFVAFNAEEEGLIGSQVYARQLRLAGLQVAGVFQMDMIGNNLKPARTWEAHFGYETSQEVEEQSAALARLLEQMRALISPSLEQIQFYDSKTSDPAAERSDHGSFHTQGYPACCISEDFFAGPGSNEAAPDGSPHYHKKTDTVANIDPAYAADIARAVGAAAWKLATISQPNHV